MGSTQILVVFGMIKIDQRVVHETGFTDECQWKSLLNECNPLLSGFLLKICYFRYYVDSHYLNCLLMHTILIVPVSSPSCSG